MRLVAYYKLRAMNETELSRIISDAAQTVQRNIGAGGLEAGLTILAMGEQIAPPTINLDNPSEDCDLDFVPHTPRPLKIEYALSNSFGFGGTNGSLIFKRWHG